MQITRTNHYIEVKGYDDNGEFKIQIQKDCLQLRIKLEDDEVFIDTNYEELKDIRDAFSLVIDNYKK